MLFPSPACLFQSASRRPPRGLGRSLSRTPFPPPHSLHHWRFWLANASPPCLLRLRKHHNRLTSSCGQSSALPLVELDTRALRLRERLRFAPSQRAPTDCSC